MSGVRAALGSVRRRLRPPQRTTPRLVVLGHQKSGTSAIAALVARRAGLTVSIDIAALWGRDGVGFLTGREPLSQVVRAHPDGFDCQVLKEPNLTFQADQVRAQWPDARWLFVVRDPRETLRSMLQRNGLPGHQRALLDGQLDHPDARWMLLEPELWGAEPDATYIEVAAHRWCLAADAWHRHRHSAELVQFESFLADKHGTIDRIVDALGLTRAHPISDAVDRPYQPPGDRSIGWARFFGADNLARVEAVCAERMPWFGYEPTESAVASSAVKASTSR